MRKIILASILLMLAAVSRASTTTVTATVTDTDGQAWANGTWSAKLILPSGPFGNVTPTFHRIPVPATASGVMDANGVITATLTDTTWNTSLDQDGGQWTITACPNASITVGSSTGCATVKTSVTGAFLNLSSRFSGVVAPRFPPGPNAFGYLDIEVVRPTVPGDSYYNTGTNTGIQGLRLWDGKQWNGVGGGGGTPGGGAGGDLAETYPNPSVAKVQGVSYSSAAPTNTSMVPAWTGTAMSPRQLTQDDILPGFSITGFSCSGCGSFEIGATVTNPAFTASYSSTPTSATITNTDGIDSPHAMSTPFTSATIAGSFSKTSSPCTTFTLSAVSSSTKTANQQICFQPRAFGGVGTAGATGCTASGNNCTLTVATGTLSNAGLSNSQVGQLFGPYSPVNQYIYILLTGNTHTNWIDNNTGFAMPFDAPIAVSYLNQNGATVSMYLYRSSNSFISGAYAPKPTN